MSYYSEESGMSFEDTKFFVIPDDESKTLILCPTEKRFDSIKLNKTTAQLLVDIILHQIQKW